MNWISINCTLPELNKHVLITDGKTIAMGYYSGKNKKGIPEWSPVGSGENMDFNYDYYEWETTHWMELPKLEFTT